MHKEQIKVKKGINDGINDAVQTNIILIILHYYSTFVCTVCGIAFRFH